MKMNPDVDFRLSKSPAQSESEYTSTSSFFDRRRRSHTVLTLSCISILFWWPKCASGSGFWSSGLQPIWRKRFLAVSPPYRTWETLSHPGIARSRMRIPLHQFSAWGERLLSSGYWQDLPFGDGIWREPCRYMQIGIVWSSFSRNLAPLSGQGKSWLAPCPPSRT